MMQILVVCEFQETNGKDKHFDVKAVKVLSK